MPEAEKQRTVAEIMRRGVATVAEDSDLAMALQSMLWRQIRHLPVTKEGAVVGLLTERDLLSSLSGEGSSVGALGIQSLCILQ